MANHLKMAIVETIFTLQERGWSQRRIARELGISRDAVSRYLKQRPVTSKPANAPPQRGAGSGRIKTGHCALRLGTAARPA
jgi:orotate phosphoribosyltransferase-like protein